MTSKISFSKFIKENIRHRSWLSAVSAVLLLLAGPVYTMMALEGVMNRTQNVTDSYSLNFEFLKSTFPGFLNGCSNRILAASIFVLAILCAVTGFSYLHSREKVDFYHSFPLTRKDWFGISYISGLLIFLIPYLAVSICTLCIGSVKKLLIPAAIPISFLAILGGILGFLIIYHTVILGMMLTGKLVTGVLASLALLVYGSMTGGLFYKLASNFFATYCEDSSEGFSGIASFLSPFSVYLQLLGRTASVPGNEGASSDWWAGTSYLSRRIMYIQSAESGIPLLLLLFLTLATLALLALVCIFLYRIRPSEAAENALAFPKTAPFIKVLISVPTALYIGLFISSLYSSGNKWIIIISILSVILLCGLIEFIYHMDLRKLFAGFVSSLVSIAGVIAILCIMQFDLIGYDTRLPAENTLKEISVTTDSFSSYFMYLPSTYLQQSSGKQDSSVKSSGPDTSCAPLYALAQEGIANLENGITPDLVYSSNLHEDYIVVKLCFMENKGKKFYREYAVKKEEALSTFTLLCQSEDYRRSMFPVFQLNHEEILDFSLMDIYKELRKLKLSEPEQEALLEAYQKDTLEVDIPKLQSESPIGEFIIEIPSFEDSMNPLIPNTAASGSETIRESIGQFYIYDSYKNTLSLLEEYGYPLLQKIEPEDVVIMTFIEEDAEDSALQPAVADAAYSSVPSGDKETLVTDPEQIAQILEMIEYSPNRLLGDDFTSSCAAEITLKGNRWSSYYTLKENITL